MQHRVDTHVYAVVHGLFMTLLIGLLVWRSAIQPEEVALLRELMQPSFSTVSPLLAVVSNGIPLLGDVPVLGLRILQGLGLLIAALCFFDLARLCRVPRLLSCLSGPLLIGAVFAIQPALSHRGLFLSLAAVTVWAIIRAVTHARLAYSLLAASSLAAAVLLVPGDGLILGLGLLGALFFCPHRARSNPWFDTATLMVMGCAIVISIGASLVRTPTLLKMDTGVWRRINHVGEASVLEPGHFTKQLFDWISTSNHWVNLPIWYMKTGLGMGMLILVPLAAVLALSWMLVIKRESLNHHEQWACDRVALWFVSAWVLASGVTFGLSPVDLLHACGMSAGALLWCLIAAVRWMDANPEPHLIFIRWLPLTLLGVMAASSWFVPIHAIMREPFTLSSEMMQRARPPVGTPFKTPSHIGETGETQSIPKPTNLQ